MNTIAKTREPRDPQTKAFIRGLFIGIALVAIGCVTAIHYLAGVPWPKF